MRNWFVSVLVVFAGLSHGAVSAQKGAPVIDMHLHAHHIPLDLPAGAPPPYLPRPCQPKGAATATPEESFRKTLEAMDRHNLVLGFLSGADLGIVQDWAVAAPYRFIASPFIEEPGKLTPQMLRQEYAARRLSGMGEIGSHLVGVAPNDPALAPYFALGRSSISLFSFTPKGERVPAVLDEHSELRMSNQVICRRSRGSSRALCFTGTSRRSFAPVSGTA